MFLHHWGFPWSCCSDLHHDTPKQIVTVLTQSCVLPGCNTGLWHWAVTLGCHTGCDTGFLQAPWLLQHVVVTQLCGLAHRLSQPFQCQPRALLDKPRSLQAADEDIPPPAAHPVPQSKNLFCHVCCGDNEGQLWPRPPPDCHQLLSDTNGFSQSTWTKNHKQWRGKLILQITKQVRFNNMSMNCSGWKDFSSCSLESMASQEKLLSLDIDLARVCSGAFFQASSVLYWKSFMSLMETWTELHWNPSSPSPSLSHHQEWSRKTKPQAL